MVFIIVAGGDEAGRGAVLGPLVVSIVSIAKGKEKKLSEIGVRDSKILTRRKREYLYDEIYAIANEIKVYKITPQEINEAMKNNISLNELEAMHFAKLVDSAKTQIQKLFLDSPDIIPERFGIRVSMYSQRPAKVHGVRSKAEENAMRIVAEHKADSKYPVVSASSIISKVVRDREIAAIKKKLRIDIGSGYPSDATTISAIRSNLENTALGSQLREYWQTLKSIRQLKITEFLPQKQ